MIVAVAFVCMVKVAIDDVVGVVAVGDRFVSARGAVSVILGVAGAVMGWRAGGRVLGVHGEGVLIDVVTMDVVQVSIVEEVLVTVVLDRLVSAVRAMGVIVVVVGLVLGAHDSLFSYECSFGSVS